MTDKMYRHIIGMIVCLERFLADAEERGNAFFIGLLEKQHVRLKGLFERRVVSAVSLMPMLLGTKVDSCSKV